MDLQRQCEFRLHDLAKDTTELRRFAERRLVRMNLPPELADDSVQRAFLVVLKGLESSEEEDQRETIALNEMRGRRPRPEDLVSPAAFENYMRGVICSQIEALTRRMEFKVAHMPLGDAGLGELEGGVRIASRDSTEEKVHMDEMEAMIFARLQNAPKRLQPTIQAWKAVFHHSDRIPDAGRSRKYVGEVRELAKKAIKDFGGIE